MAGKSKEYCLFQQLLRAFMGKIGYMALVESLKGNGTCAEFYIVSVFLQIKKINEQAYTQLFQFNGQYEKIEDFFDKKCLVFCNTAAATSSIL